MRRTVTITPEPRPYTCTIRVCDLCGKERPGEYLDDGGGLYDRPEVTIECRFVPIVETALGIRFH